jgi:hypothetical protein
VVVPKRDGNDAAGCVTLQSLLAAYHEDQREEYNHHYSQVSGGSQGQNPDCNLHDGGSVYNLMLLLPMITKGERPYIRHLDEFLLPRYREISRRHFLPEVVSMVIVEQNAITALAHPLHASQVEAACRLHARVLAWTRVNSVMESLAEPFPDYDEAASLVKVAVLNQLFGTNVRAIEAMANHIAELMRPNPSPTPELVDKIALLATAGKVRKHVSFASKFAHFFFNDDFSIFDSYALASLRFHLGKGVVPAPVSYVDFLQNIEVLRTLAGLSCSARELDHYLWLSEAHRRWTSGSKTLGKEAKALFSATSEKDLRLLTG